MNTPTDSNSSEFPDAAGYPDGAGYLDEGTADPEKDSSVQGSGIIGEDPDFAVPPPAESDDDDGSAPD